MSEEKQKFHSIIKKYVNDVPYVSSGEKGVPELEIDGTYGNKRTSKSDYDNVCKSVIARFKPTSKLGKSILRLLILILIEILDKPECRLILEPKLLVLI